MAAEILARLGAWRERLWRPRAAGIALLPGPLDAEPPAVAVAPGSRLTLRFDPTLQRPAEAVQIAAGVPVLEPTHADGIWRFAPGPVRRLGVVMQGPTAADLELELQALAPAPSLTPLDGDAAAPQQLIERAREAGLVGLGGAGFAMCRKLRAARAAGVRCLVVNAAECEPGLFADRYLLRRRSAAVSAGARLLARAVGAERVMLAVAAGEPVPAQWTQTVLRVPSRYPAGDERQIVRRLTGRVLPSGARPHHLGVVVVNVATVASYSDAALSGMPLLRRPIWVRDVARGTSHMVDGWLGMPVRRLLEDLGRQVHGGAAVDLAGGRVTVVEGGPMMGRPLDLDAAVVTAASIALTLDTVAAATARARPAAPAAVCIRCGECAAVCPQRLAPQRLWQLAQAREEGDRQGSGYGRVLAQLQAQGLGDCTGCRCCDAVCPTGLALADSFAAAGAALVQATREETAAAAARRLSERRARRLARRAQQAEADRQARRIHLRSDPDSRRAAVAERLARARRQDRASDTP